MYQLIKQVLFKFDPENIHYFVNDTLKNSFKIPGVKALVKANFEVKNPLLEREVFGIKFKNPIGIGAGFDKNALLIDELDALGFGFIEIGTVTPKGQAGNDKPRLFRLVEDEAIINRMGFNNDGVDVVVKRLREKNPNIIVGGNIGKNKVTPNEDALSDYLISFRKLHDFVNYFVVNVSSPNTPNLRELQEKEPLKNLLANLQEENKQFATPKPILLKIAPDLTNEQLDDIIEIVQETKIAGVIATNTTISRDDLRSDKNKVSEIGMGGVSGKPLTKRSTEVIRYLAQKSNKAFPIIGIGGIHSPQDAIEKLEAGADLLQLYTGFIYEGPGLVKRINKELINYYKNHGKS